MVKAQKLGQKLNKEKAMKVFDNGKLAVVSFETGEVTLAISKEALEAFKLLVNKGLNCWDKAPPELKELGDILSHGEVLQDYNKQG